MKFSLGMIGCVLTLVLCGCDRLLVFDLPSKGGSKSRTFVLEPADHEALLQAVVKDVLTNPLLENTRKLYGAPVVDHVVLMTSADCGRTWPDLKKVSVSGRDVKVISNVDQQTGKANAKQIGVRLDVYDLSRKVEIPFRLESPIRVTIMNALQIRNGEKVSGCSVFYMPKNESGKWSVEFKGLIDT